MSDTTEPLAAVLGMEYNGAEGHEEDTVASIVAEMRETWTDTPPCILSDLADRIEAAAERERIELRESATSWTGSSTMRKEATMPSPELKPCKCGGEAFFAVERVSYDGPITAWSVRCRNVCCPRYLHARWWPTREAAVAAWNRRAGEETK